MKKIVTYLAMLSMILSSVPAAAVQAAAADDAPSVTAEQATVFADITGRFFYLTLDRTTGDYINTGYVTVFEDGTYTYCPNEGSTVSGGTITVETEKYESGNTSVFYVFKDNESDQVFGRFTVMPDGTFSEGNPGIGLLERDERPVGVVPADIAGAWLYQVLDIETGEYVTAGAVTVYEDGSYLYQNGEENIRGTVIVEPEYYPNGSCNAWLSFYNENGEWWIGCTQGEDPTQLAIGNGGMARLIADGQLVDVSRHLTPANIAGKWFYQPVDGQTAGYLTVDENGRFFYMTGDYDDRSMETVQGQVTVFYDANPDGTESPIFRFITDNDEVFEEGMLSEDGNKLDLSQDGSSVMVRDESVRMASASDIIGTWIRKDRVIDSEGNLVDDRETVGYMTVRAPETGDFCSFVYRDLSTGKVTEGSVFAIYQMYPDGNVQIWYEFYDNNGEFFTGCQDTTKYDRNTMYLGEGGDNLLEREDQIPNDFRYNDVKDLPVDIAGITALTGEWKCDDCTLYFHHCDPVSGYYEMYTEGEGKTGSGIVRFQYQVDNEGNIDYDYVLYAGEYIYLVFDETTQAPVLELLTDDTNPYVFERSAEPYEAGEYLLYDASAAPAGISAQELNGVWTEIGSANPVNLEFENCGDTTGEFILTSAGDDGTEYRTEGIVKLQYNYDFAGEREYLYVLYVADENGEMNQIYMTITADGERPLDELKLSNTDISFARTEVVVHTYSAEQLIDMAIMDYEKRTGITPASASAMESTSGAVTIILKDENDEVLDAYTVDPDTGIGERMSDESDVNLPQTGNNSLKQLLFALSAFLMTGFGFFAVRQSGMLRRKENEQ